MAEIQFPAPLFGISVNPSAQNRQLAISLARISDDTGLDFLTIQDHPYNPAFLDTWTLLSVLGGITQHVRLMPNVANLPLRPPAMLAKAAATLDILTNGRVELGLGAGGFWEAIVSYGGPNRTPGEAVSALEEAIHIIHALWQPAAPNSNQTVNFSGQHYQLHNAKPGPAPAHPIGIWLGALGPRMLQLTGRLADGWIISASYIPPENVPALQTIIDESAQSAGRNPRDIRRAYNLAGSVVQPGSPAITPRRKDIVIGPVSQWVDVITRYYHELHMDTFIFWPIGDAENQVRLFAEEVVPGIRAAVSKG